MPPQDKNRPYLDRRLDDITSIKSLPDFTYPEIVQKIRSIDVIWFNGRGFPQSVFEVEHSTDFKNSLIKFHEMRDFNVEMRIVAPEERKLHFESSMGWDVFRDIRGRVGFQDYERVADYHAKLEGLRASGGQL